MSIKVAVINGKAPSGGVGGVSDADLANLAINAFTSGVVGQSTDTNLKAIQLPSPNNQVRVGPGKAYVPNPAGTMFYHVTIDANVDTNVTANSSGNPRIDAVVIKVDTVTTPDATASNIASIVIVPGTPAGSPVAPTDAAIQTSVGASNAFLRLSNVTASSGFSTITTSNISDVRTFFKLVSVGTIVPDGSIGTAKFASEAWTSYTPVLTGSVTNPNIGTTGTVTGFYQKINRTVYFRILVTFGGTGISIGSGVYLFTLPSTPVTENNAPSVIGTLNYEDQSASKTYAGVCRIRKSNEPTFGGKLSAMHPSYTTVGEWSELSHGSLPWATGDTMDFSGSYEAAS